MPPRSARPLAAAGLAAALTLGAAVRATAQPAPPGLDMQALHRQTALAAAGMIERIARIPGPGGGKPRIIVLPLGRAETDLPPALARQLGNDMKAALANDPRLDLVDADALAAAYTQLAFTRNTSFENLARRNDADILVRATVDPRPREIVVHYVADDLREGHGLVMVADSGTDIVLPRAALDAPQPPDAAVDGAVADLGGRLATRLRDDGFGRAALEAEDDPTRLASLLLARFRAALDRRLEAALGGEARAITGDHLAPVHPAALRLAVQLAETDEAIEAVFSVSDDAGTVHLTHTARIALGAIDPALLDDLRFAAGSLVASGSALLSGLTDRALALAAARAVARDTLLARAGALPARTSLLEANSPADALRALAAIGPGLTYDEQWTAPTLADSGRRLRITLRARVALLGPPLPGVRIEVPRVLDVDEELRITIRNERPVMVALFEWQSDDTIVRLYPKGREKMLVLPANSVITLSRPGEDHMIMSLPPGVTSDTEGLIAVTAERGVDVGALSGEMGRSVAASQANAREANAVFGDLARLRDAVRVTVLPYQIRRP
jgi:hypothetical protein